MAEGGSLADTFIGPVRTLLEPTVLVSVGAMVCMHFLFQSFTSFYPTYLIEIKGVNEQTAAFVYGLFFALGTVFQPTSGVVGDRIGFRRTMLLIVIVTMTGLLLLPLGPSLVHPVGITAILSLQRGFWPIANTYLIDLFPEDIQGPGLGLSRDKRHNFVGDARDIEWAGYRSFDRGRTESDGRYTDCWGC
jgi:MFS family permease